MTAQFFTNWTALLIKANRARYIVDMLTSFRSIYSRYARIRYNLPYGRFRYDINPSRFWHISPLAMYAKAYRVRQHISNATAYIENPARDLYRRSPRDNKKCPTEVEHFLYSTKVEFISSRTEEHVLRPWVRTSFFPSFWGHEWGSQPSWERACRSRQR